MWSVTNLGRGYSSPVISGDKVIISGDEGEHLVLHCLDIRGNVQWRATNGGSWKDPYPGARASATLSSGRVYHHNAHGRVACLDLATGREIWSLDTFSKFGSTNLTWGHAECLLVDERAVYVTVGGTDALMVALNKTNGTVIWKSPPLNDSRGEKSIESASYSSPILTRMAGRKVVIGCSLRHLFAVEAETGALMSTAPMHTAYSVLAAMPVLVGSNVFMTAPHGKGGALWRVGESGSHMEELWRTTLDPCQGGVVYTADKLIGSYYSGRKGWAALDAKTGKTLFEDSSLYKGQAMQADGRLYALAEDGWMALLEPAAKEFILHGKFRFAEARQRDAWAHPVVLDKRLYLRFHERLTCFDVAEPR